MAAKEMAWEETAEEYDMRARDMAKRYASKVEAMDMEREAALGRQRAQHTRALQELALSHSAALKLQQQMHTAALETASSIKTDADKGNVASATTGTSISSSPSATASSPTSSSSTSISDLEFRLTAKESECRRLLAECVRLEEAARDHSQQLQAFRREADENLSTAREQAKREHAAAEERREALALEMSAAWRRERSELERRLHDAMEALEKERDGHAERESERCGVTSPSVIPSF